MDKNTSIVFGGSGSIGSLFCKLLLHNNYNVIAIDPVCDENNKIVGVEYIKGTLADSSAIELSKTGSLVIICTPAEPALNAIEIYCQILQPDQCLVDTMSVKTEIVAKIHNCNPVCEVISINPMFGPSLGFHNQNVVSVDINPGEIAGQFLLAMASAGANIIHYTAEQHDRITAITQVSTHAAVLAFAMTLSSLDYDLEASRQIWTPPHKTLMALVARIMSADPEVYRDIQVRNPYAKQARHTLINSMKQLDEVIATHNYQNFSQLFDAISELLGGDQQALAQTCELMFEAISTE